MKKCFFIAIVFAICSCGITENRENNIVPFDRVKWDKIDDTVGFGADAFYRYDYHYRDSMSIDLLKNYIKVGDKKEHVISILGEPKKHPFYTYNWLDHDGIKTSKTFEVYGDSTDYF